MPERFSVSESFNKNAKVLLEEVLPEVKNLPEGVNVVRPSEIENAQKPFVVVSQTPSNTERIKALRAGTCRYVTMTFNGNQLKRDLEGQ